MKEGMMLMELFQAHNCDVHKFPVIVSIPHSGRYIPEKIRQKFCSPTILPNMDWYLDILYDFLKPMEVTLLIANYSRYIIDLNRSLDMQNSDSDYRYTLIYSHTTFNKKLYEHPITDEEIKYRIENYYLPYYNKLEQLIKEKLCIFEKVYLLDLHSYFQQTNIDICLGNVDNKTSTDETLSIIERCLADENFSVDKNNIFKGGHCIRYFQDKFPQRLQCIALELQYKKYLENRYFFEEEVAAWDENLFKSTQQGLMKAFKHILQEIKC